MLGVRWTPRILSLAHRPTPGESEQALYGSQIDRRRSGAFKACRCTCTVPYGTALSAHARALNGLRLVIRIMSHVMVGTD